VGMLVLWFVVMREGAGCGANVQSGIGAADVGDVGEFTVAVAIRGVDVEEAGSIDNTGDIIGITVAVVGISAYGVDVESIGAFAGGEGTGSDGDADGVV